MLRGILSRLEGGCARGMGGGANREIERGARSLFRGLAARRR